MLAEKISNAVGEPFDIKSQEELVKLTAEQFEQYKKGLQAFIDFKNSIPSITGMPVILTSTNGSEHVMRSVIDMAGVIVPQAHDPMDVVAAYEELRAMPERLDLRRARALLEDVPAEPLWHRPGLDGHRSVMAAASSEGTTC